MLETLLEILSWDLPPPEIYLDSDATIILEWYDVGSVPVASINIDKAGNINWNIDDNSNGDRFRTDLNQLKHFLGEICKICAL